MYTSKVTVALFKNLGYVVNLGAAETFVLPVPAFALRRRALDGFSATFGKVQFTGSVPTDGS